MRDEPVRLAPYDPAWPGLFAEERDALDEAIGPCKPHPSRRTHHLHLIPTDSQRFRDELAFRDRLRADPAAAREYEALKRDLAQRFSDDREAYTNGKSDFIFRALA